MDLHRVIGHEELWNENAVHQILRREVSWVWAFQERNLGPCVLERGMLGGH